MMGFWGCLMRVAEVFGELTDLMTAMLTGAVVLARYTFFSFIVMAILRGQRLIDPLREDASFWCI